jgi:hypothetical protein
VGWLASDGVASSGLAASLTSADMMAEESGWDEIRPSGVQQLDVHMSVLGPTMGLD